MGEIVRRVGKMIQWCPQCRMIVEATLVLEFDGGYHESDQSTCNGCGKVLWDWRRAKNSKDVLSLVPSPPKPAKQMRLF